MQLKPENLERHLAKGPAAAYLIAGDEILLQNDAADLVRERAVAAGYSEIKRNAQDNSFSWSEWLAQGNELSLFGEQRLLELRLSSAKIGTEGSAALCQYLDNPPPDTVLVVTCPRISGKPKWLQRFTASAVFVPIYPLAVEQLPQWLMRRGQRHQLALSADAAVLLAERIEGNLMAAVQELEKLALSHASSDASGAGKATAIDAETIDAAVTDSARFSAFDMLDHALKQNPVAACRALAHIREQGLDPAALLGAIGFELRRLDTLLAQRRQNRLDAGLKATRMIASKQAVLGKAVARLSEFDLERCIALAARADLLGKRGGTNQAFTLIEMLLLRLAGKPLATEDAVLAE
ncbi:MAG: DNA polymerase III subunit delta [Pseudomonadales bacterium]|nr:DNA polymerase III subunit delta [Pseudomonadales bacterium]